MAAGAGRGLILPADTPAPAPRAPGWGHGSGVCSGCMVLGAQAGVQLGLAGQRHPPSMRATGCGWGLLWSSPRRDPLLAATWPPKHPLSPLQPSKAANSRSGNPATPAGVSRTAHGRFPPPAATTRRAPLTGEARSGLAFPTAMAAGPLPSSDALLLLLLLFRAQPSLQPLLQKTLTSAGGERSQPGCPGTSSYPFSWLCFFPTKKKSQAERRNLK